MLLRYSVLLAGVSAVGVRNDRILCAKGEEMWGYAGRTGRLVEVGVDCLSSVGD